MTVSRENQYGKISVSNHVFAKIAEGAFNSANCRDNVWPSTKRGKLIVLSNKYGRNEFANNMSVDISDEGRLSIEFYVIVKFGKSINNITGCLIENIANYFQEKQGRHPQQIKVKVTGVKSKQIAKRDIEVVKQYEA